MQKLEVMWTASTLFVVHTTCRIYVFVTRTGHSRLSLQVSTELHMSKAVWLLFLDTQLLDQFFSSVHIPFDCEFLVVQPAREDAAVLTEVYRVTPSFTLQKYPLGTWSQRHGLNFTNISFYQRRDNFQGIALKTAFLKVSIFTSSFTNTSYKIYVFRRFVLSVQTRTEIPTCCCSSRLYKNNLRLFQR